MKEKKNLKNNYYNNNKIKYCHNKKNKILRINYKMHKIFKNNKLKIINQLIIQML